MQARALASAALTLILAASPMALAQGTPSTRKALVLDSGKATLTFDLAGGSLADFHLNGSSLNPFSWGAPNPNDPAIRGFGHFLCLDRWGPPSSAEGANGMPYHGEAAHVLWSLDPPSQDTPAPLQAQMSASLPLAGLHIQRSVQFSQNQSVALIRESISNKNKLGRTYNCVQHPTIGAPFLDESTLVDCNGRQGFAQGGPMPNPEEPSSFWPRALTRQGDAVNLRHLSNNPDPNVVSYCIDEPHGWITAASPSKRLLVGYLWKTTDYPWVSLWRDVRNGKPAARGLEFGTTGLHQPFPILVQKGRIFGRPLLEFLDANQSVTKSYAVFLAPIPVDFSGTETIQVDPENHRLIIKEQGKGPERDIVLPMESSL